VRYQYLGHNVRFFRKRRRFSQRELGARATPPLTQPTVSRIELGARPADDGDVDALAGALGVGRDQLLQRPRVIRSTRPVVVLPPLDVPRALSEHKASICTAAAERAEPDVPTTILVSPHGEAER
jgi:transcriptional regulator with XRE-family HTH domain